MAEKWHITTQLLKVPFDSQTLATVKRWHKAEKNADNNQNLIDVKIHYNVNLVPKLLLH